MVGIPLAVRNESAKLALEDSLHTVMSGYFAGLAEILARTFTLFV
jgi:hypothetical protein